MQSSAAIIFSSFLLLSLGSVPVTLAAFKWDTTKIPLANTLGSQTIHITSNLTEFEVAPSFTCPNNYHCSLQVVIESMTCVRNISSSEPNYIKFYMYENVNDEIATATVDECGDLDTTTLYENSIIGRGMNVSKILIRPVGPRWEESDFTAAVFIRVNLQPMAAAAESKEIKINRILSNFELNFVDDAQYKLTMAKFENEKDDHFPSAQWKRSVRVSIENMKCESSTTNAVQGLQIDKFNAIGFPETAKVECQNLNSDQVTTIAVLNPGEELLLTAIGDGGWKNGLMSALIVFTTQMSSEEVGVCPTMDYFNCQNPACENSESEIIKSICIPVDLTCNKRHNCLDSCKWDESADICSSKPTCTGNEYGEQLRIEVNKIGTWFVGLILVLLLLICLIAFYVGLTAGQFKSLKATLVAKLNDIKSVALSGLPSYHQVVDEKQA